MPIAVAVPDRIAMSQRERDLLKIMAYIKALGKTSVKGGNRLTLLRDADGDGAYETRVIFAENLDAPYPLHSGSATA